MNIYANEISTKNDNSLSPKETQPDTIFWSIQIQNGQVSATDIIQRKPALNTHAHEVHLHRNNDSIIKEMQRSDPFEEKRTLSETLIGTSEVSKRVDFFFHEPKYNCVNKFTVVFIPFPVFCYQSEQGSIQFLAGTSIRVAGLGIRFLF